MREQNALPCGRRITKRKTAKDDVDNVGAGRAAKGENPSLRAKKAVIARQSRLFSMKFMPDGISEIIRL